MCLYVFVCVCVYVYVYVYDNSVEEKKPMASLDTSRYRLEPPPMTKRNDPNAWKAALDNAHAQLEHQYTRIQNLELLLKNGDKVCELRKHMRTHTDATHPRICVRIHTQRQTQPDIHLHRQRMTWHACLGALLSFQLMCA